MKLPVLAHRSHQPVGSLPAPDPPGRALQVLMRLLESRMRSKDARPVRGPAQGSHAQHDVARRDPGVESTNAWRLPSRLQQ